MIPKQNMNTLTSKASEPVLGPFRMSLIGQTKDSSSRSGAGRVEVNGAQITTRNNDNGHDMNSELAKSSVSADKASKKLPNNPNEQNQSTNSSITYNNPYTLSSNVATTRPDEPLTDTTNTITGQDESSTSNIGVSTQTTTTSTNVSVNYTSSNISTISESQTTKSDSSKKPVTFISTWEPYEEPRRRKNTKATTTNYRTINEQQFESMFGPPTWPRFFAIPNDALYAENTLKFERILRQEVGDVPFQTYSDGSRLIRAETEEQSYALQRLAESDSNPFGINTNIALNTRIGTVAVPIYTVPKDIEWQDCSSDIHILLNENDRIKQVTCYTLPPRGKRTRPVYIAKIAFKQHNLPESVFLGGENLRVKAYRPSPRQCQRCLRFGHPEKHCRSYPRCSNCASSEHVRTNCQADTRTCANCNGPHSAFYKGCSVYKFETEVAIIRNDYGYTLRRARIEARRQGFTPHPITRSFSQNTSNTNSDNQVTSPIYYQSLYYPSSSGTSTVPTSSLSTSPITSTILPSVTTSNPFAILNPDTPTTTSSEILQYQNSSGTSTMTTKPPQPQRRKRRTRSTCDDISEEQATAPPSKKSITQKNVNLSIPSERRTASPNEESCTQEYIDTDAHMEETAISSPSIQKYTYPDTSPKEQGTSSKNQEISPRQLLHSNPENLFIPSWTPITSPPSKKSSSPQQPDLSSENLFAEQEDINSKTPSRQLISPPETLFDIQRYVDQPLYPDTPFVSVSKDCIAAEMHKIPSQLPPTPQPPSPELPTTPSSSTLPHPSSPSPNFSPLTPSAHIATRETDVSIDYSMEIPSTSTSATKTTNSSTHRSLLDLPLPPGSSKESLLTKQSDTSDPHKPSQVDRNSDPLTLGTSSQRISIIDSTISTQDDNKSLSKPSRISRVITR